MTHGEPVFGLQGEPKGHVRRFMRIKHPRTLSLAAIRRPAQPTNSSGGFTILEIALVLVVASVIFAISLPSFTNSMSNLRLGSSAGALADTIQSARYQAISTGCTVQISVLYARQSGEQTYQKSASASITGTPPACSAPTATTIPFTSTEISVTSLSVNGAAAVPINSSNPSASIYFNPNGTVSTTAGGLPATFQFVLSQANGGTTKTVNVSGVGYVKVTAP